MADMAIFTGKFLDALGRWQRGWKQDPAKRALIAALLVGQTAMLPDRFRRHDGTPLYRKRHLYRREDQRELVPLFLQGILVEGSPTSWSKDLSFAVEFDGVFDDRDPNSAAGAIFRHVPTDDEVILNIPALWCDPDFVAAAEEYRETGGAEAATIFHFRGKRAQNEIILSSPLRLDEIFVLSGLSNFESLCGTIGVETEDARETLQGLLQASKISPETPRFLSHEATQRVVQVVVDKQKARILAWMKLRIPTKPAGRRGRLRDAFDLGKNNADKHATFEGWRKLAGEARVMEARWSDGTVAYRRSDGAIWLY